MSKAKIAHLADRKRSALAEVSNRLFFRFFQAANTLHTKGTKALQPLGVTTQQWSVLGALSRPQAAEGMTVGELSQFLLVSRQNLTGVLDRLASEKYIERVPDLRDRRSKRVRLTAKGEQLWRALDPLIYSFYDAALNGFSFEDRSAFLHYVNNLQKNMTEL